MNENRADFIERALKEACALGGDPSLREWASAVLRNAPEHRRRAGGDRRTPGGSPRTGSGPSRRTGNGRRMSDFVPHSRAEADARFAVFKAAY